MKFTPNTPISFTEEEGFGKKKSLTGNARTEARLCAVQGTCPVLTVEADWATVRENFLLYEIPPRKADKKLFLALVTTVEENMNRYNKMLEANLKEGWDLYRVDPVARAIMLCALAELETVPATPLKVVLSEYLNLAHGFLDDAEVGFINAVLDTLVKKVRGGAF